MRPAESPPVQDGKHRPLVVIINIFQIKLTAWQVNLTPFDKGPVLRIIILLVSSYKNSLSAGQYYKADKRVKDHQKAPSKKASKIPSSNRLFSSCNTLWREGERRWRVEVRQKMCRWHGQPHEMCGARAKRGSAGGVRHVPLVLLGSKSTQGTAGVHDRAFLFTWQVLKKPFPMQWPDHV